MTLASSKQDARMASAIIRAFTVATGVAEARRGNLVKSDQD
jgi:hypothetical protein